MQSESTHLSTGVSASRQATLREAIAAFLFVSLRPVVALVVALAAGGAVGITLKQRLSDAFEAGHIGHDSLHYYRDSQYLQHLLFEVPEDVLRAHYRDATPLEYSSLRLRLARSFGYELQSALALQVFGYGVRTMFWANLIMFSLGVVLLAYVAGRVGGFVAAGVIPGWLMWAYDGGQIATAMAEPAVAFWLAGLTWAGWLCVRGKWRGLIAVPIGCGLCVFYKAVLVPVALLAVMTWGFVVVWRCTRRYRRVAGVVGAVLAALVLVAIRSPADTWIERTFDVPRNSFRSNGGYALWMGSLPTSWTGCYSGRISTRTFRAGQNPDYRRQFDDVVMNYGVYYAPLRAVFPYVVENYINYPFDRVACFGFRYSRMAGANPLTDPAHVVGGILGVVGAMILLLRRDGGLLVGFLAFQVPIWIHALSRYRARDREQVVALAAFFAGLCVV